MYKIFVDYTGIHFKNEIGLKMILKKYFTEVNNINDADICYFPSIPADISQYPNKKFIFGPHFSVLPDYKLTSIKNRYNNAIYIQPSEWVNDLFSKEFNTTNMPIYTMPFPMEVEKFKETKSLNSRNDYKCFIYMKDREHSDLNIISGHLKDLGYNFYIFNYNTGYNENDYLSCLQESSFGVWLGRHESQGFALEEALLCNVPLLIWDVTKMSQERGCHKSYYTVKTKATAIPYWTDKCGEYFLDTSEFESSLSKLIKNKEKYEPRKAILELLALDAIYEKYWKPILKYFNLQVI